MIVRENCWRCQSPDNGERNVGMYRIQIYDDRRGGMNFPEIVDIALPAEGVFHNLVFVSIRKT